MSATVAANQVPPGALYFRSFKTVFNCHLPVLPDGGRFRGLDPAEFERAAEEAEDPEVVDANRILAAYFRGEPLPTDASRRVVERVP